MLGISAFAESPFAALAGAGPNAIVNVIGQAATGGVGTVALPETVAITGQSSTGAVGTTTLSWTCEYSTYRSTSFSFNIRSWSRW